MSEKIKGEKPGYWRDRKAVHRQEQMAELGKLEEERNSIENGIKNLKLTKDIAQYGHDHISEQKIQEKIDIEQEKSRKLRVRITAKKLELGL